MARREESHEPCGNGHSKPKGKDCTICLALDAARGTNRVAPKKPEVAGNQYTCQICKDKGKPNGCDGCGGRS
jgi:hypothetical protein